MAGATRSAAEATAGAHRRGGRDGYVLGLDGAGGRASSGEGDMSLRVNRWRCSGGGAPPLRVRVRRRAAAAARPAWAVVFHLFPAARGCECGVGGSLAATSPACVFPVAVACGLCCGVGIDTVDFFFFFGVVNTSSRRSIHTVQNCLDGCDSSVV